jgi:hypothetical protein
MLTEEVAYRVEAAPAGGGLVLRLTYRKPPAGLLAARRKPSNEVVDLAVPLEAMPMRFGGVRWWARCPLPVDGRPCGRRVAKLYQPPWDPQFGCRVCHRLTYASVQARRTRVETWRKDPAAAWAAMDSPDFSWSELLQVLRAQGGALRGQTTRQVVEPASPGDAPLR